MIIDPILETCIAAEVSTGLTLQHDRAAIGHQRPMFVTVDTFILRRSNDQCE